jgi:hypothetical protein
VLRRVNLGGGDRRWRAVSVDNIKDFLKLPLQFPFSSNGLLLASLVPLHFFSGLAARAADLVGCGQNLDEDRVARIFTGNPSFMEKLGHSVVLARLEKFAGGVPTSLTFDPPSRSRLFHCRRSQGPLPVQKSKRPSGRALPDRASDCLVRLLFLPEVGRGLSLPRFHASLTCLQNNSSIVT